MERSRKKACKHCRHAKARCNLDIPTCSRCVRKNIDCIYETLTRPPNTASSTEAGMFHSWLASTESAAQARPQSSTGVPSFDFAIPSTPTFQEFYGADMEWNESQNIFTAPAATMGAVQEQPEEGEKEGSVCWFEIPSDSGSETRRSVPLTANQYFDSVSALELVLKKRSPATKWEVFKDIPKFLPNLLDRKKESKVSKMIAGNSVWALISEISLENVDGKPGIFIHPKADFQSEALANCASIVSMYLKKTPACTPLVHKTFMMEIQRLYDEFSGYDEKGLLHALQALTVYMITLAADTGRCKIVSMITRMAMGEVATQAIASGYVSASEKQGNFPSWEEWVCAESKRRTFLVLHLLEAIIDFDIGSTHSATPDCSKLELISLPCSKVMWEATTAADWEDEYKRYLSTRKGNKMLTIGDLQRCRDADVNTLEAGLREDFATWSTETDIFGMMLFTSLLLLK